jgi:hypothetical protein
MAGLVSVAALGADSSSRNFRDPVAGKDQQGVAVRPEPGKSVARSGLLELGDGVEPMAPGIGDIIGSRQPGLDWGDLFDVGRGLKDQGDERGRGAANGMPDFLEGKGSFRRDAAFVLDDVSAGIRTDATARGPRGRIAKGVVDPTYDLSNVYAYSSFDRSLDFHLYAGVERLSAADGTVILEFNRELFTLGEDDRIVGRRVTGDLQVLVHFAAGILSSLDVGVWMPGDDKNFVGDWQQIEHLPVSAEQSAEQCNSDGTVCAVCNGTTIQAGAWPTFDAAGEPTTALVADTFLELGLNLTQLLGVTYFDYYERRYATIQVSTLQDYALGTFVRASKLARFDSR